MALTDSPPTTTNYGITLPKVGADRNNWGNILNAALESAASNLKTVDDTLGDAADSATPSLAYQLTQAVSNASTAASNSATAITVASKLTNNALVALTNNLSTAATNASTAASNASSAKTAADAALVLANAGYYAAD